MKWCFFAGWELIAPPVFFVRYEAQQVCEKFSASLIDLGNKNQSTVTMLRRIMKSVLTRRERFWLNAHFIHRWDSDGLIWKYSDGMLSIDKV